jgi:mRNA interferase ChpB
MERGDIYLVLLDPTSGHEQQGTRPVLIVSPSSFNQVTKTPIVLPITSGGDFAPHGWFCRIADGGRYEDNGRCPV